MKYIKFFIFLFLCLSIICPSYSYGFSNNRISRVILYPNMALIKKDILVPLKKGENNIKIPGFPGDMVDGSIQVNIGDKKGIELLDIKVERNYLREIASEDVLKLKENIKKIKKEIELISNELNSYKAAISFLRSVEPFPKNTKVSNKEVESFSKYLIKSLNSKFNKISLLQSKMDILKKKKENLEKTIDELNSNYKESKNIYLYFKSKYKFNLPIEISYLVKNAKWRYSYDIKVDSYTNEVYIYSYALIKQSTVEDWKHVSVEINTSRPYFGKVPVLHPWYVDIEENDIYRSKAINLPTEPFMKISRKGMNKISAFKGSVIRENKASYSFIIPLKISIPSDNKEHRVFLSLKNTKGSFLYIAIPKLLKHGCLNVIFKNPMNYPLARGRVKVFLDGIFVTKFFMKKPVMQGEEMKLSLGVDGSIRTVKKLVRKFTQYKGVLSKHIKVVYEYEINIYNGKNSEIEIEVKDNVPVSRNEKIKVKLIEPRKNEAAISKDGIITWKLKLMPLKEKKLKVKFSVEYPKDVKIIGL